MCLHEKKSILFGLEKVQCIYFVGIMHHSHARGEWSCQKGTNLSAANNFSPPLDMSGQEGSKNRKPNHASKSPIAFTLPATYAHHASLCYSCRETRTHDPRSPAMFPARHGEQHAPIHARIAAPSPVLRLGDGLLGGFPAPEQDRHQ